MSGRFDPSRSVVLAIAIAVVLIALWALRDIMVLVALSVLLAFVLNPLVTLVQRIPFPRGARLPRGASAAIVVIGLVVTGLWLLGTFVPRLVGELGRLAERMPEVVQRVLHEARVYAAARGWSEELDPIIENLRANAPLHIQTAGAAGVRWVGRLFGNIGQIVRLLLLPVLTFYLLAEAEAVRESVLRFFPEDTRDRFRPIQSAVNRALQSYVRGQTVVCLIMGIAVGTSLKIAGFPAATLLGLIVGLAEIVPFIGFWFAMTAIVLTGYSVGLQLALTGAAIYVAINTINGYLILPRVMGQHLKMHPFVIIVSVLAGATLLGPVGVLIALPGAAVIQALIEEFAGTREEEQAETG